MAATIKAILTKQGEIEQNIASITKRLEGLESQLTAMNTLKTRFDNLETVVERLEKNASYLLNNVDDLENRSRRNNIIIYGLTEERNETNQGLADKIQKELFKEKLGIEISSIERCHRLGKPRDDSRPVIIKLQDYRDKELIFSACKKLKGTGLSVTHDFSKNVREIRKKLWQSSADERDAGAKVKLIFDKLSVDGTKFAWDDVKNRRYKVNKTGK